MDTYSRLNRPIAIVPYRAQWPSLYEEEKRRISAALGNRMEQIEHFGSTAIPGLAAKPVIDIMIGVQRLDQAEECIPILESLGYTYMPELEAELPDRRFLWKEMASTQRYHIHLTQVHGPLWENPLAFRDYLREHPEEAERYGQLKADLAAQCGSDIGSYIQGKTAFVQQILDKAKANDHV